MEVIHSLVTMQNFAKWPALSGPQRQLFLAVQESEESKIHSKRKRKPGWEWLGFPLSYVLEETVTGFAQWAGFILTYTTKNSPGSKDSSKTWDTLEVGMEIDKRQMVRKEMGTVKSRLILAGNIAWQQSCLLVRVISKNVNNLEMEVMDFNLQGCSYLEILVLDVILSCPINEVT